MTLKTHMLGTLVAWAMVLAVSSFVVVVTLWPGI